MSGMFTMRPDGRMVEMRETPYAAEDVLQGLIADYPNLLAGDQFNPNDPRRWLLVAREAGVPDQERGGNRWSLDHLLVDQDAIPTLVEVKRATDTRIRREVAGQMLDYAANASSYWNEVDLAQMFGATCQSRGLNPDDVLAEHAGDAADGFWEAVGRNLREGRLRLVFAADVLPKELKRIIEFLNDQMDRTEVLGIELRQYEDTTGSGLRTLVPRVIGQSARADQRKEGATTGTQWTEGRFFQVLEDKVGREACTAAKGILNWAGQEADWVWWGKGKTNGSFTPGVGVLGSQSYNICAVWTSGRIAIQFCYLRNWGAFQDENLREELRQKINEIPGCQITEDKLDREPTIPLDVFADPARLDQLTFIFQWIASHLRAALP